MKTIDEIKRDMDKCAKRAKKVIMYSCDVEEMAEYTETVSNTLIVGLSLLRQLEQDNAQKDERIRRLEREKAELLNMCEQFGQCVICKHTSKALCQSPCCDCWYGGGGGERSYWEWCGVEEEKHET